MKNLIIIVLAITCFSFPCFAGEKIDWPKFESYLEKASFEAARKADIATQKEWDKIQKGQKKEIEEIIKMVGSMEKKKLIDRER